MCDPATIGVALSVASTAAAVAAQNQQTREQDKSIAFETERQDKIGREAAGAADDSLGRLDRAIQERELRDTEERNTSVLQGNQTQPLDNVVPFGRAAPKVVQDSIAGTIQDAVNRSADQARNVARLRAGGDVNFGNNIELLRNQGKIGILSGLSRGSSSLLPLEMQAANRAGQNTGLLSAGLAGGSQVANAQASRAPRTTNTRRPPVRSSQTGLLGGGV